MSYAHSIRAALLKSGKSEWTLPEIVVLAWQHNPANFGLKGYADQYPDSNRVGAALCGRRGMIDIGMLVRFGPKEDRRFRLATEADRKEQAEIQAEIDRQREKLAAIRGQKVPA